MINEQEIAQFIIEQVKKYPTVTGARLGSLINAQYPGLFLRATYGGLRKFVERFCGAEIRVLGKYGKDDVYHHAANPEPVLSEPQLAETVATTTETAWRAFTAPASDGVVWIDVTTAALQVLPKSAVPLGPPWREISGATTEEHRSIAREFLPQIDLDGREPFQKILLEEHFWDGWFALTRDFNNGRYFKQWLSYRFQQLCKLFVDRLQTAGVPDQLRGIALGRLKQSKSLRKEAVRASAPESARHAVLPAAAGRSGDALRAAILSTIENLGEDELRRIWLPVGAIVDALRTTSLET